MRQVLDEEGELGKERGSQDAESGKCYGWAVEKLPLVAASSSQPLQLPKRVKPNTPHFGSQGLTLDLVACRAWLPEDGSAS